LVVIATAATVIASQAVISGVFSVTTQAVSLGLLPRVRVEHSSADIRRADLRADHELDLMIAATRAGDEFRQLGGAGGGLWLGGIGRDDHRDAAHLEPDQVAHREEEPLAARGLSLLFIIDIAFLLANLTKLEDGGWLPLTSGFIIYWLMQTWAAGRASVMARLLREQKPVRDFLVDLKRDPPVRKFPARRYSWMPRLRVYRARCSTTSSSTASSTSRWCC
jgi:KUP system potassium uptake protein